MPTNLLNLFQYCVATGLGPCDSAIDPFVAFFFFNAPPPTEIYTLSLHDALPISRATKASAAPSTNGTTAAATAPPAKRSEEHTSELQSRRDLVCRLLLEKKKKTRSQYDSSKQKTTTN